MSCRIVHGGVRERHSPSTSKNEANFPGPKLSERVPDEPADGAGKLAWLVLGDKRVAVGDLHQASLREEFGQASSVLGGHDAVLDGPGD